MMTVRELETRLNRCLKEIHRDYVVKNLKMPPERRVLVRPGRGLQCPRYGQGESRIRRGALPREHDMTLLVRRTDGAYAACTAARRPGRNDDDEVKMLRHAGGTLDRAAG
jgi:hypothetical protein